MSARISIVIALLAVSLCVAAKPASPLPKLKNVGDLSVQYVASKGPDGESYVAQWHTGLTFRNASQVHSAVCAFDPKHDDYHVAGIHLTPAAARQLAADLTKNAGTHTAGGVEVVNHRNGRPNIWATLAPRDAKLLAGQMNAAAQGHAAR